jgi:protein SCO1/2
MKRVLFLAMVLLALNTSGWAAQSYSAKGLVLKVDKQHNSLVISCEEIPGYMQAMVMSFPAHDPAELASLETGTMIEFTLVVDQSSAYVENIRIRHYEGVEQDPMAARRLKLMAGMVDPASAAKEIKAGDHVPDFSLIDQNRQAVTLSQFSGKVVAISFTYTHCALPNFCFRISNSFRALQKRFASQMGRDLVLLTITFDPTHDTPEVMAKYGQTWSADPKSWRLLTGSPPVVEKVCNTFGISFWPDEGLMDHSLHTFVVDRNGNLLANLEGNEFTSDQLGDLVQSVLETSPGHGVHSASR